MAVKLTQIELIEQFGTALDDRDWVECAKVGVRPLFIKYVPLTTKAYRAKFAYKFGVEESKNAAFHYLVSHFGAINLYAYRFPTQPEGEFWVKFDLGGKHE